MKYFKYSSVFFIIVCALLIIRQEWEYDEAWSYIEVTHNTPYELIQYAHFTLANNHIINSLFIKLIQSFGVENVIFYRVLSFCSLFIYSIYYYKFIKLKLKNADDDGKGVAQFPIVYFLPYILPFFYQFSQARGYSLAIAGNMASIYYFFKLCDRYSTKNTVLFIVFGALSSLSIFSFIFPFASMLIFITLKKRKDILIKLKSPIYALAHIMMLFFLLLVVYYIYEIGKALNTYDLCIAGGNSLFKSGMLSSLFSFLALQGIVTNHLFFIVIRTSIFITLIPALYILYKNIKMPNEHKLFILTILLILISHFFFKSKYPFTRTISYLLLFFYLPFLVLNIKNKTHKFIYNIHFFLLISIGLYGIAALFRTAFSKNTYGALAYINNNFPNVPIFFDLHNPNIDLYNQFYFQGKLPVKTRNGAIDEIIDSNKNQSFVLVSQDDSTNTYTAHNLVKTGYVFDNSLAIFVFKPKSAPVQIKN